MRLNIVGDGLAGLMLARRLRQAGLSVHVYGDGRTNTPPVGLVHLFAGRTFRRSALELKAFERAIAVWREEPLAQELPVHRLVQPGDRLDRSAAEESTLPESYAPRRRADGWLEYGPGFSVAAQELEKQLRDQLGSCYHRGRVEPTEVPTPRIWALGTSAPVSLPEVAWDLSSGRTVEAEPAEPAGMIRIGKGLHIAPIPGQTGVLLGGRSSCQGLLNDELSKALELTGVVHIEGAAWHGKRCAPALDRRPAMGWLDRESFAFLGFGARGLFWLPYCVDLAVEALRGADVIPPELHCRRILSH